MRLLTRIIVIVSLALAPLTSALAGSSDGSCGSMVVPADVCRDGDMHRAQAATDSESKAQCLGPFVTCGQPVQLSATSHVGGGSEASLSSGIDPTILLGPPRA